MMVKSRLIIIISLIIFSSCSWFNVEVADSFHALDISNDSNIPVNLIYESNEGESFEIKLWPESHRKIYEILATSQCGQYWYADDCKHQITSHRLSSMQFEGEVKESLLVIEDLLEGFSELKIAYSKDDTLQYYGFEVVFDTITLDPEQIVELQETPFTDAYYGNGQDSYYHSLKLNQSLLSN